MAVYDYTYFANSNHTIGASQIYYSDSELNNYAFTTNVGTNHPNDNLSPNVRSYFTISAGSVIKGNTYYHHWFPAGSHSLTVGTGDLVSSYIDGLDDNAIAGIGSYVYGNGSDCKYESTSGIGTYTPTKAEYSFSPTSGSVTGGTAVIDDFNASYIGSAPATNPSPAHQATNVDFSDRGLSWTNPDGTTGWELYLGYSEGSLQSIATGLAATKTLDDTQRALFTDTCYWRVDCTVGGEVVTGDVWYFVVAAPGKAWDPTPGDDAEDVRVRGIDELKWLEWQRPSGEQPDYHLYFRQYGDSWGDYGEIPYTVERRKYELYPNIVLDYYAIYEWRVDTYDPETELTTTGDTWTFISEPDLRWSGHGRRSDYDTDAVYNKVWQPGVGWVDINSLEFTGGGRFKNRILVIGHKVLYFGSI